MTGPETITEPATAEDAGSADHTVEEYRVRQQPYYLPVGDEVDIFTAAWEERLPVLLRGPTGCGKTRFLEYMTWVLRGDDQSALALTTISCHEDLTASDLVGRYLLTGGGTSWLDGPLTRAVRRGGICYLDEVVEARKDTIVAIHPLTDYRRQLPIAKRDTIIDAHEDFLLAVSYNPGYQSAFKDLKPSTRQRFVAIEFSHPGEDVEARIISHESGIDLELATSLARIGSRVRHIDDHGLKEGPSTRLLVYAGRLIRRGVPSQRACEVAITHAVTDDPVIQQGIDEVVTAILDG